MLHGLGDASKQDRWRHEEKARRDGRAFLKKF